MAEPHGNNLPAAGSDRTLSAQEVHLLVYHRCIMYHLGVLDAHIVRLENGSSFSGLLEQVITNSQDSSGSGLLDEIAKTRAMRERIYGELLRNLQQLQGLYIGDGSGGADSPLSASSACW